MENTVWALLAFFGTSLFALAGCLFCWYQALRRQTPTGAAQGSSVRAWRASLWAPPTHYTAAGNRYRVAAIACMILPGLAWAVCLIVLPK